MAISVGEPRTSPFGLATADGVVIEQVWSPPGNLSYVVGVLPERVAMIVDPEPAGAEAYARHLCTCAARRRASPGGCATGRRSPWAARTRSCGAARATRGTPFPDRFEESIRANTR